MKLLMHALLILLIASKLAYASEPVEQPNEKNKNKVCMVGTTGYYIHENDECIDTEVKCQAKGGKWGGYESGIGRSPGCNLPTTDAGKGCTDSRECQGACVAYGNTSPPKCICSGRTFEPKGQDVPYCTVRGVEIIHAD